MFLLLFIICFLLQSCDSKLHCKGICGEGKYCAGIRCLSLTCEKTLDCQYTGFSYCDEGVCVANRCFSNEYCPSGYLCNGTRRCNKIKTTIKAKNLSRETANNQPVCNCPLGTYCNLGNCITTSCISSSADCGPPSFNVICKDRICFPQSCMAKSDCPPKTTCQGSACVLTAVPATKQPTNAVTNETTRAPTVKPLNDSNAPVLLFLAAYVIVIVFVGVGCCMFRK